MGLVRREVWVGFKLEKRGLQGGGVSWVLGGGACREASPWKAAITGRLTAFRIGMPYRVHCPWKAGLAERWAVGSAWALLWERFGI